MFSQSRTIPIKIFRYATPGRTGVPKGENTFVLACIVQRTLHIDVKFGPPFRLVVIRGSLRGGSEFWRFSRIRRSLILLTDSCRLRNGVGYSFPRAFERLPF